MDGTSLVQVCLWGKRGGKEQELIQMVIPVSGSGKLYAALCIGGYLQGDLQGAVVCPYIHLVETERAASEPCLLIHQDAL